MPMVGALFFCAYVEGEGILGRVTMETGAHRLEVSGIPFSNLRPDFLNRLSF